MAVVFLSCLLAKALPGTTSSLYNNKDHGWLALLGLALWVWANSCAQAPPWAYALAIMELPLAMLMVMLWPLALTQSLVISKGP